MSSVVASSSAPHGSPEPQVPAPVADPGPLLTAYAALVVVAATVIGVVAGA